jgi:tRNA U54 and U55 pseudouridine synthase Pus10
MMTSSSAAEPCSYCLGFLSPGSVANKESSLSSTSTSSSGCPVCLGLFHQNDDDDDFSARLHHAIRQACEPYYGSNNNNRFSARKDPPAISLPGDLAVRYHMASLMPQYYPHAKKTTAFVQHIKHYAQDQLNDIVEQLQLQQQGNDDCIHKYPPCVEKEEQGSLALQVILAVPNSVLRPAQKSSSSSQANKKGRRRKHYQQFETQGGHPRTNLEQRLLDLDASLASLWTLTQAAEWIDQKRALNEKEDDWFILRHETPNQSLIIRPVVDNDDKQHFLQIHVAVWRRPFLVKGNYTKTRRDVSQTPFFIDIPADGHAKKRQRLGTTSIEELILPHITAIAGEISTLNNSPSTSTNIRYGMAKFHASGREDMDVKMILPDTASGSNIPSSNNISGRPFCCEIIDALRMPTPDDLQQVVHAINHSSSEATTSTDAPLLLPASSQYYGQSPLGVGVDALSFAFAADFKNLQSDTEQKHKYYACLCWSEQVLPPLDVLKARLTRQEGVSLFPLELKQQTPVRVLHRRANAVRIRHILSCHQVVRLDDHHFRIHISTDAGTYVKEFCHGDLGRTQPNVATLLALKGKIDILTLDCEGIQINN